MNEILTQLQNELKAVLLNTPADCMDGNWETETVIKVIDEVFNLYNEQK